MVRLTSSFASLLAVAHLCAAYIPLGELAGRQVDANSLSDSYDYIIAGGGQAGLVIAERLTEDPTKHVLVIEYGWVVTDPAQFEPSSATNWKPALLFNVTTPPQPGLNNRTQGVYAAATAGGGSTINGMMLDRAAPLDYDNWGKLGNGGWSFSSLLPYFKKSSRLTPPTKEMVKEFGITYDLSAYGDEKSPISLSYATFNYPSVKPQYQAMLEAGVKPHREQGLNAHGLVWYPSALDGKTVTRSASVSTYYQRSKSRPNLHLLTNTRVNEVTFDRSKRATGVTYQARDTANGVGVKTARAKREVILAAGFLHTPQILQRSGIGPAALLKAAKIPVLVDLPGVGSNFQDHAAGGATYNFTTDFNPNPNSLVNNATFIAWADELWAANRTGPRSLGVGMVGSWLPLYNLASDYKTIAANVLKQKATDFLPASYTPEQVKGFLAQRELIVKSYLSDAAGQIELPFGGAGRFSLSLEHPLSRGTVLLNTTDKYAEPIVDYNTFVNPTDPLIVAKAIQFIRKWTSTKSFQVLSPVELSPGAAIATDADLVTWTRNNAGSTTAHGCCTAALSPRNLGGVVDEDLLVYGVKGLSVGDISLIPLIPATHTCATVYAISEKAADLIKLRNRF